jgi:dihydrolipoamide dehydrogenase
MNSTGALALADVPQTLLIVGGGYAGLELGTVYAASHPVRNRGRSG